MSSFYKATSEGLNRQSRQRCPQLAIRPGYHGPCHRGHHLCIRALKRSEATERNARTLPERRSAKRGAS